MAQAPQAVDFSGKWVLRTSEGLDDYLKSEGVGMLQRKAAGLASMTQVITQNKLETIQIKATDPRGTTEVTFTIDGKENKFKNLQGNEMIAKLTWNDDHTVLTQEISGDKSSQTVKRYIANGEMILDITNDKGKTMKRIFKKQ